MACLKVADVFNERSKEYYRQENAKEYAFITADEYTESQVVAMEKELLMTLDFEINQPTVGTFLALAFTQMAASAEVRVIASFLGDLALLSAEIQSCFSQLEIAGAVIALTSQISSQTGFRLSGDPT